MSSTSGSFSSSPPSRSAQRRRRLLLLAGAALLAAASLLAKATTDRAGAVAPSEQRDARLVAEFLTARGWVPSGSGALLAGGGGIVLRFQVPGCEGVVGVSVLPPNGEMASLFAQAAGPAARVFYAYRGRTSPGPPRLAYLAGKLDRLAALLGWPRQLDRPVVAVSEPPTCRLETTLPWAEL